MIKVAGIPFDANSSFLKGSSYAPRRIRLMDIDGSANAFAENGLEVLNGVTYNDMGDINFANTNPAAAYETIHSFVATQLMPDDKLLCLGGDHSISFPIIAAYAKQYPDLHILHIDAHADLYDNFDDNPYSHASPFARIMEAGLAQSLTQVGIRTLNTHQREQAKRFDIHITEMKDFTPACIDVLKGPLYISLDLDVLDPAFAPGVSHHEPGGLSTRQLLQLLQNIKVPVVGADIVEYNPTRDVHNMTAMVAYKLLKELIAIMV
jgi:arginase